ncbi:unnamed protein product [Ilex paraguariensis]|uniref:DC1 domain-containing protein n=1 Tax=Ilex paraguariensis TaxID=185542 RepID=A0ABC8UCR6_9AQUA
MELEREIEHFSHVHPLVFERSLEYEEDETFTCNGCCQRALDHAYRCRPCDYLLHERCAKLPTEIEVPKHPQHLLTLNAFLSGASVISKSKNMLAYFCRPCTTASAFYVSYRKRYFAHVRCAISPKDHAPDFEPSPFLKEPTQFGLKTMTPDNLDANIEEFFGSRMQLPVEKNSEDPSTVYIGSIRLEEIETDPEIHPWILE